MDNMFIDLDKNILLAILGWVVTASFSFGMMVKTFKYTENKTDKFDNYIANLSRVDIELQKNITENTNRIIVLESTITNVLPRIDKQLDEIHQELKEKNK